MPPFRNPFGRRPAPTNDSTPGQGENTPGAPLNGQAKEPQRSDYTSSRTSSALSIKANKDEPNEFKLSGMSIAILRQCRVPALCVFLLESYACTDHVAVVNDSGVYLPVHFILALVWSWR